MLGSMPHAMALGKHGDNTLKINAINKILLFNCEITTNIQCNYMYIRSLFGMYIQTWDIHVQLGKVGGGRLKILLSEGNMKNSSKGLYTCYWQLLLPYNFREN